jgi:hypothetical protein
MEYLRAFSAELLKIRRSWAFTLSGAVPFGVAFFIFLVTALRVSDREWIDVWAFYLRGVAWSWLLMMMPFYSVLLLALLASIDHNAGAWKVLLTQPISRAPLYIAKLGVGLLLAAWSQVVLAASCLGLGSLLPKLRPYLGDYHQGVDVPHFLVMLVLAYAAGFLIMAIHTWISIRSPNFVLSLAVVIFAEVANVLGMKDESLQRWWPWLYPFDAARLFGLQLRDPVQSFWSIQHLILASVVGAAVVTALALWDFSRREVT